MDRLDSVFRALADPTRRAILSELARREATVGELARPFDISLMAVSKHIRTLEGAGLVKRTREGRTTTCSLVPGAFDRAKAWMEQHQVFWSERVNRLDALLRSERAGLEGDE